MTRRARVAELADALDLGSRGSHPWGFDCPFRSNGTNVGDALTGIMRHIRAVHTLDWFELEELHEAARSLLRKGKGGNPPPP